MVGIIEMEHLGQIEHGDGIVPSELLPGGAIHHQVAGHELSDAHRLVEQGHKTERVGGSHAERRVVLQAQLLLA